VQLALPASHVKYKHEENHAEPADGSGPLAQRVQAFERASVLAELDRNGRNITQTARALGLERSHLYKKCQQLGIDLQNLSPQD
jgi:DNA-binding NtrC family response regulator